MESLAESKVIHFPGFIRHAAEKPVVRAVTIPGGIIMTVIWKTKIQGSFAIASLALASLLGLTASQAMAQEGANTFSQEVAEQTISFPTVNPYTKAPGSMTITFSGVFHATRLTEPTGSGISRVTGGQRGTFTFVPDDSSQPTISGRFRFSLAGKTQPQTDTIHFAFTMDGMAQDGSLIRFVQTERALVTEGIVDVSFGRTEVAKDKQRVDNQ